MNASRIRSELIPNLLLAAVLVAAQWGALAHALEHDAGTPQSQVCATCVAATQLGSACIDTRLTIVSTSSYSVLNAESAKDNESQNALVARQRGPPLPL